MTLAHKRRATQRREMRFFFGADDFECDARLVAGARDQIVGVARAAARFGRDRAHPRGPVMGEPAGADFEGATARGDRRLGQLAGLRQPLAQPDRAREGIHNLNRPERVCEAIRSRQLLVPRSRAAKTGDSARRARGPSDPRVPQERSSRPALLPFASLTSPRRLKAPGAWSKRAVPLGSSNGRTADSDFACLRFES